MTVRLRIRLAACGGALASTVALVTACGGEHDRDVPLPSSSTPAAPPATTAPTPSRSGDPKQLVTAAYTGYMTAARKAVLAQPETVRGILRPYVTGPYLDWEVRQILLEQSANKEPWGTAIVHVGAIDLLGPKATLHDCQDASNSGLADSRTHQLIPNSRGVKNWNLVADMTLGSDGRWRVAGVKAAPGTCHAG